MRSERERGRATRVKPSRPQRSSSWAAESVRARGWPAGPRAVAGRCGKGAAGPSEQATEWAAREKEKEKGLGWFGWAKMEEDEFFNV